ncbi:barstar family protein [Brevibacillus porteri]|uniref:barstar family protein n=1 Tax=Brevibacillus porteri TaxID=2126350 RepID=UPI003D216D55
MNTLEHYGENDRLKLLIIDVSTIKTSKELHQLLKKELGFPSFTGLNWSAFWDAITGLVELPEKIVFEGWDNLLTNLPIGAEILKKSLEDMNTQYPDTFVEIEYK